MPYSVYGVGNALVDIQARVSDAELEQLGYPRGGMTLVDVEAQATVLQGLDQNNTTRCAGGSAANTVIGVADFGGKAAYAGKTGSDALGEFWLEDMRRIGVGTDVDPTDQPTGTCVVLITEDAQRTMLTSLGASSTLGPEDIDEEMIRQSEWVYVEGYLFTGDSTKAAAYRAIELAKKNNVKVAFTVSDPFLISLFRDEFLELLHGPVDLLFCNLDEARALTEKTDPIDCAQAIHQHAPHVAMTLGADGSLLMNEGSAIPIEGVAVEAIDTTGAGDMYAAGILHGITSGMSWKDAGHLASHAAARIVSQLGARLQRKFTAEEIAELQS